MNEVLCKINKIRAIYNGSKYKVNIEIPLNVGWIDYINFVILKGNDAIHYPMKHIKNENGKSFFEVELDLETRAIYHYYFTFKVNNQTKYINNQNTISNQINMDDMSKMSVNFETPEWAKGKIMYHIFVDRFNRGSIEPMHEMPRRTIYNSWEDELILGPNKDGIWNADFYGGDLKGIEQKLDYIKSLGVDIIYLSPVIHSQSNHRYDAADYENVDPYAGCNYDLKSLCDEAHKRGMKIVLDAVFNHTGNDSKYFNEYGTFDTLGAYQSIYSTYASFYRKHYHDGKLYYDHWWGMPNLPVCNGNSHEWKNYILGVGGIIDKWFNLGIDGLRLDVADELTDEFIEGIRIAVKRNKPDGFILGEVWKNPMRMNRGYIASGKCMDSVMNYSLIDALIRYFKYNDINKLAYVIKDIKREYPEDTINTLMNFTSTHDISRAINIFSTYDFQEYGEWAWNPNRSDLDWCKQFRLTKEQYEYGKEVYKAYIFALTFMPGILSIFYGDEVGVQGLGNLANRKPFPWGKEDLELLNFFRYIGMIRKEEPFLQQANLEILDINKDYFMFERHNQQERALITISRSNQETDFIIPKEYQYKQKLYTLKKSREGYLAPHGGIVIKY